MLICTTMRLLATLPDLSEIKSMPASEQPAYNARQAARVVLFDGPKIALIHVSRHNYYMLPGGGIEEDNILASLRREINEELGCSINPKVRELGKVIVYFNRWMTRQTDYGYIAQKTTGLSPINTTEFEKAEGHKPFWCSDLNQAIALVHSSKPRFADGQLIRERELIFLHQAKTVHVS